MSCHQSDERKFAVLADMRVKEGIVKILESRPNSWMDAGKIAEELEDDAAFAGDEFKELIAEAGVEKLLADLVKSKHVKYDDDSERWQFAKPYSADKIYEKENALTLAAANVFSLFSLAGKHALITGGGSGIGRAIAETLAAAGAKVTIAGRRAEKLRQTAESIANAGGDAAGVACDVAELPALADFVARVRRDRGDIDILVNAAGDNPRLPIAEVTPETWRAAMDVNLSSAFFIAQAAAPAMLARGWGRVLNVASLQCRLALANGAAYGAAKGGVAQLTRAMAREWSGRGVNANALAPGFFPTAMTESVMKDGGGEKLAARAAIGRNGELADLRGAALFLASPASDYVTGQTLFVDGGFSVV